MSAANTITLDLVKPERVSWLWPGRVPLGKLTVFDGDPGLGKSLVTLDIAARLTTGRAMPDGSQPDLHGPAAVVLLTVEDGLGDTIRPRLDQAGANVQLVTAITGVPEADGYERSIVLPDDWQRVFGVVEATGARLVILDPLMALLSGDTNSYRDQDVRRALTPGVRLAEETGAALVVVRHLTKGGGVNAVYRRGGSIGITGAARSVQMFGKYPEDESDTRRVMAAVKANLSAPVPSLAYCIHAPDGVYPRVSWEGEAPFTAADLLVGLVPPKQASPERDDIISILEHRDTGMSPQAIADALGKSVSTVRNLLRKMEETGAIERTSYGIYGTPTRRFIDSVDSYPQESTESTESMVFMNGGTGRFLDDEHCQTCGAALYTSRPGGLCLTCTERIAS